MQFYISAGGINKNKHFQCLHIMTGVSNEFYITFTKLKKLFFRGKYFLFLLFFLIRHTSFHKSFLALQQLINLNVSRTSVSYQFWGPFKENCFTYYPMYLCTFFHSIFFLFFSLTHSLYCKVSHFRSLFIESEKNLY